MLASISSVMDYAVLISLFVMISLWEYCMFFRRLNALPYRHGFDIFSLFQWTICAVALVHIWGWLYGIIATIVAVTVVQYVTHFTIGLIYNALFGKNPLPALAGFAIMVWISGILTVANFFV